MAAICCSEKCLLLLWNCWRSSTTISMEQSLSWEVNKSSASQKFPHVLWNRKVHYHIHKYRHQFLYWARSIQSMPPSHFLEIHFHTIRHLLLSLPHQNPVYTSPVLIHATCPAYLILLNLITGIIFGEHRSLSSSVYGLLHSPVTSSLLSPNILLSTLFSNTLSLRFTLNVSDQVSHSYKTPGTIIVLYILLFLLLG